MTEDRKIPAIPLRPDKVVRPGLVRCKRGIIAIICLLIKLLAIPLGCPPKNFWPGTRKTATKWLVISSVFCFLSSATAEGIYVNKAELRQDVDGYHLSASYDIGLTQVMQQALSRGIPLYFVGEFSLTRPRWYWMDEDVFQGEQTIKLSYNVLTRQYRISRGSLFQNFASLEDALNILARQNSPVIPAELLKKEEGYIAEWTDWIKREGNYIAAVRLRLDNAQLPKLLQVNALSGSDWTLNSDWHRWEISPAEMAASKAAGAE